MLFIKRIKGSVALSWRPQDRLFSPEFLKGLAIAAALHFVLLFAFRIVSHPCDETIPLLQPVHVEVDVGSPVTTMRYIAHSPLENVEPPELLLPALDLPSSSQDYDFTCSDPDFSAIEYIDYEYLNIDFDDDRD